MGYTQDSVYSFWKVDDYFSNIKTWEYLRDIKSFKFHTENGAWGRPLNVLEINAVSKQGNEHVLEVEFVSPTVWRVRFNPGAKNWSEYIRLRSRAVVKRKESVDVKYSEKDGVALLKTPSVHLRVDSFAKPEGAKKLRIQAWWIDNVGGEEKVSQQPIFTSSYFYFTPNGPNDWHVIQSVVKPPSAQYIGFGEQGGQHLVKNEEQVTYFNYDNMRYKQVYNKGPLEPKEPMYHSEPFFIEFNGTTTDTQLYGLFVDNPGQVMLDIGYMHSNHIMMGTRFGGLDYYVITGKHARHITTQYSHLIGTAHLKPRYCLGYHQGCYGYDTREKVIDVVQAYRNNGIPLDGMHVDVDIQKDYKTFTIDRSESNPRKFPDPEGMFSYLRTLGVKCSTNITPIVSNKNAGDYKTYQEGVQNNYFVIETRDPPYNQNYQDFPVDSAPSDLGAVRKGEPYVGEVWYGGDRGTPGHYPNFAHAHVREWWGKQYTDLFQAGLEFVWQDMTTPAIRPTRGDMRSFPFRLQVDSNWLSGRKGKTERIEAIKIWNLYSYNLHQATYNGLTKLPGRENIRPFIIGRGAFSGVHRYAGLWAGDNSSSWDFFKMNINQAIALGISSMSINGQDIGGFEPEGDEKWVDPQLLIRWTAAGAFLPWFRNHYNAKASKTLQEPYAYQYINLDQANVPGHYRHFYESVLPVCKYFIQLRYRLMQVFYDALFENMYDGLPISRALILNDCDRTLFNDKARYLNNEFFLREDILVAPIVDPEVQVDGVWKGTRDIYLPNNNDWWLFMDNKRRLNEKLAGGITVHNFDASISADPAHIPYIVPIYVRAGAIVPTIEQENYVGELNAQGKANPITFNIYPGARRNMYYKLYLDDGISRDSAPVWPEPSVKGGKPRPKPGDADYNYDEQMILEQNDNFPRNQHKKVVAAQGKYRRTLVTHKHDHADHGNKKSIEINFLREYDNYTPKYEKFFYVAFIHPPTENDDPVKEVLVTLTPSSTGKGATQPAKPIRASSGNLNDTINEFNATDANAWYYNANVHITFAKIFDTADNITVVANKK